MIKSNGTNLGSLDFLIDADNVYRTKNFIVKQRVSVCINDNCVSSVLSTDVFYRRTKSRDAEYEQAFSFRGTAIEGRRMRAAMYTRTYID